MASQASGDGNGAGPGVVSSVMNEIRGFRDKLKVESESEEAPFRQLEKSTVLLDCRVFHDANFVKKHPKRCCQHITKLLCLFTRGETFSSTEISDVFFGVTKLFQSPDGNLRRMVYLFLKEVAESTASDEIIIITSSLFKDMNHNTDLYRANSLRVLAKIMDSSTLSSMDRYIKQAIVDKNELVASCALVSGLHLYNINSDVVRRWVSEVQNAVQSKLPMVQFHALALLGTIKQKDLLAISKLVTQLRRTNVQSPLAMCLLIRYTSLLLREDTDAARVRAAFDFLDSCLRYGGPSAEMVNYEAARAVCAWPAATSADLSHAITTLHIFITSGKASQRFVAARTLSELAKTQPLVVAKCNKELETLISDPNRTIATLAITTLLKTGGESSVDRLLKEIMGFMSEITDEFKVVVVEAIHGLCKRYPHKYRLMYHFLLNCLREEGGMEYKRVIVDSLIDLMDQIPASKADGLMNLCEFIEDCEFAPLSARVLHLLGDVGPTTTSPQDYVRFMYNRVILETAQVRAAAVSALAKFAVAVEPLRDQIVVLLRRCQRDDDDEVRDRASTALKLLDTTEMPAKDVVTASLPQKPGALTRALHAYQLRPPPGPLAFTSLPHVEEEVRPATEDVPGGGAGGGAGAGAGTAGAAGTGERALGVAGYATELYKIPQFQNLGSLFRSTQPAMLTESELEYLVNGVIHILPEHVIFQFNVTNTVPDVQLENVVVEMVGSDEESWEEVCVIAADKVPAFTPTPCYVCLRRVDPDVFPTTNFTCTLKFVVKEVDVDSGDVDEDGDDDEFELEDIEITPAAFMRKSNVTGFKQKWMELGSDNEVINMYQLPKTVEQAVSAVGDFLGMQLCEGTGTVPPNARSHMALLGGVFMGGTVVLARMQVRARSKTACDMKLGVRSASKAVSQIVSDCIQ